MKTKFFKKLSFVLVVAMVLSLFVPAAGVFAAAKPSLNSKNKYLHLSGNPGPNEYNFNIKNKKKGWSYEWESDNEAIAEVNVKNGVTVAKSVGKTKVTVYITDKNGEEVETLSANVTVRDNIKEVSISNPVEKLAVGEAHDYNRSYVTEANSTKKTSAITRWTVSPDTATIDDKGVFVATAGGEYTVTALSFQSKAKYNDWKDDVEKYADYVLDTDETKVVVGASMVESKQYNLDTVNVKFDTSMTEDDVKANLKVTYVIGGEVKIKEQDIKSFNAVDNTDNKVYAVTLYDPFVPGYDYVIEYPDMDDVTFRAATTRVEDVVDMEIATNQAYIGQETQIVVNLKNDKGVIINKPYDNANLDNRLEFTSPSYEPHLYGDTITMFEKNDKTTVTVTFHTWNWDTSGKELGNIVRTKTIPCVDRAEIIGTNILAWTIETDGDPGDFSSINHRIAEEDMGRQLFVKIKLNNGTDDTNVGDHGEDYSFNSSNSNLLFVDDAGYLVPIKKGNVIITVEYKDHYVGSFPVEVLAERFAANLVLNSDSFSLSNALPVDDKKTVKATVKDQYNEDYPYGNLIVEQIFGVATDTEFTDYPISGDEVTFKGAGQAQGKYRFKLYTTADVKIARYLTVDVKTPQGSAVSWKLELSSKDVDLKIENDINKSMRRSVNIGIVGYDKFGVKATREAYTDLGGSTPVGSTGYVVNITNPKNENIAISGSALELTSVSGGAIILKELTGRYVVDAYYNGRSISRDFVNVKDTQDLPKFETKSFLSTNEDILINAFNDAFDIKLGDFEFVVFEVNIDWTDFRLSNKIRINHVDVVQEGIETSEGTLGLQHEVVVGRFITVPDNYKWE